MTDHPPHFVIFEDGAGEWRWRFVAANGRTMADSGEGYTERNDCREAITTFVADAFTAPVHVEGD